jgi:hypothetical protein
MKRLLLCAGLIAWSSLASAVVYKWSDEHGTVQYGDRPPDGVHAEIVELLGSHASHPPSSNASTPTSAAGPAAAKVGANAPSAQDAAAKQAVDDDVAQAKLKQCADAQERYKKLIEGRKLYRAGADGERQYLTADEIDAERLDAKRDLDTVCNSPT